MPGIQTLGGSVELPKQVVDWAETGGFHEVCRVGTNDFGRWLTRLPPGQSTGSWNATMWTRGDRSARTRAVCEMLLE